MTGLYEIMKEIELTADEIEYLLSGRGTLELMFFEDGSIKAWHVD